MSGNMNEYDYNCWWYDYYQEQELAENELMELIRQQHIEAISRYEEMLADTK